MIFEGCRSARWRLPSQTETTAIFGNILDSQETSGDVHRFHYEVETSLFSNRTRRKGTCTRERRCHSGALDPHISCSRSCYKRLLLFKSFSVKLMYFIIQLLTKSVQTLFINQLTLFSLTEYQIMKLWNCFVFFMSIFLGILFYIILYYFYCSLQNEWKVAYISLDYSVDSASFWGYYTWSCAPTS